MPLLDSAAVLGMLITPLLTMRMLSEEFRSGTYRLIAASPATHLPLTEPTFYILLSLATGPKHGYGVMQDVEGLSEHRISLSTSTLYSALRRLLDRGLIAGVPSDPDQPPTPGLPRKLYALSKFGHQVLEADMRRLEHRLQAARRLIEAEAT